MAMVELKKEQSEPSEHPTVHKHNTETEYVLFMTLLLHNSKLNYQQFLQLKPSVINQSMSNSLTMVEVISHYFQTVSKQINQSIDGKNHEYCQT